MGHVGHHVAAQVFEPGQPIGHGVEGPSQLADLVVGLHLHPLAQVAPLHPAGGGGQSLHRAQDAARKARREKHGGQASDHSSQQQGAVDTG